MKRLFAVVAVVALSLLAVSCEAEYVFGLDGFVKHYKVGSYYNVDGKKGVVFEVSDDGLSGKIISLKEGHYLDWDEACDWCASLGNGWYLPTKDELLTISENLYELNATLERRDGEKIGNSWYWSSTLDGTYTYYAWLVRMSDGNTVDLSKGSSKYVRAVSAF
ncbi:MAG: DUF1566 domain-containing protein [Tidjanibacter sp.]|nr:DUF1566 domain-containing protein [Tidjanibacter sp.]